MDDLFPTPTRLALLREVESPGRGVFMDWHGASYINRTGNKVTAAMAELAAAGWVDEPNGPEPGHIRYWRLTDAGRAVLDANPEVRRA